MYDQAHALIVEEAAYAMLQEMEKGFNFQEMVVIERLKSDVIQNIEAIFQPEMDAASREDEAKLLAKKKRKNKRSAE